jgi:hypothetical protein
MLLDASKYNRLSTSNLLGWHEDIDRNNQHLPRVVQDSKLFQDACEFEQIIHGKRRSSGVGPFASLVGSSGCIPLLYQPQCINENGRYRILIERVERLDNETARSREFAIANVYTGVPRQRTGSILDRLNDESYLKKLEENCWDELASVTQKMWKNIKDCDWSDIVTCIRLYASYEAGFLKIMLSQGEEHVRRLCGYLYGLSAGAKYSGAGDGGDLLVGGSPETLKQALIWNYFPVHFASFLVPENVPILPNVTVNRKPTA